MELLSRRPRCGFRDRSLGFETVLVAGASLGILFSLEATAYFYKGNQYLASTPKFHFTTFKAIHPLCISFLTGYNFIFI
jgi:hypothetical protein